MPEFDPTTRRETRILKELFRDSRGRLVYQMLPMCWVEYDGDPDRYLEPIAVPGITDIGYTAAPRADGLGQIVGFEYIKSTADLPAMFEGMENGEI